MHGKASSMQGCNSIGQKFNKHVEEITSEEEPERMGKLQQRGLEHFGDVGKTDGPPKGKGIKFERIVSKENEEKGRERE